MLNLPQRSELELELLVTPVLADAGRAARGETYQTSSAGRFIQES